MDLILSRHNNNFHRIHFSVREFVFIGFVWWHHRRHITQQKSRHKIELHTRFHDTSKWVNKVENIWFFLRLKTYGLIDFRFEPSFIAYQQLIPSDRANEHIERYFRSIWNELFHFVVRITMKWTRYVQWKSTFQTLSTHSKCCVAQITTWDKHASQRRSSSSTFRFHFMAELFSCRAFAAI